MNGWQRTWRQTVENFLREMRGSDADVQRDAMSDAIEDARGAFTRAIEELEWADARFAEEDRAESACRRRAELARGIGDEDTARIAERFARRHAERSDMLRRKCALLREEAALWRRDVDEMLAVYQQEGAGAAESTGAAPSGPGPADPLGAEFTRLDDTAREREAERRLEELKKQRP